MSKVKCGAKVIQIEKLQEGIFSMVLEAKEVASQAVPGQFISMYMNDASKLLPRPISLCEIDKEAGTLRVVFRVVGSGTTFFSEAKTGDVIDILGPLGNGFPLDVAKGKKAIVIGGGIGVPPMLQLTKELDATTIAVMGYRDKNTFLQEEFEKEADEVVIATDDGSLGTKGTVIDAIEANNLEADVIFACGPTPMLRGVKALADKMGIDAYISMEEKMACGVGACLACVCKSKEKDDHSKVNNKRICKDGPVFLASEIDL